MGLWERRHILADAAALAIVLTALNFCLFLFISASEVSKCLGLHDLTVLANAHCQWVVCPGLGCVYCRLTVRYAHSFVHPVQAGLLDPMSISVV